MLMLLKISMGSNQTVGQNEYAFPQILEKHADRFFRNQKIYLDLD